MCATFGDDAVGKQVETTAGEPIGVVETAADETIYVDVTEDAIDADALKSILDRAADTDEIVPIDADDVDVTSESIRLDVDDSAQQGTDPAIERDENIEAEDVGSEQRELGPGAGEPDADELPEEGRSGKGVQPETDAMEESGDERHPAEAEGDGPDDGERTVTKDRGREDDR